MAHRLKFDVLEKGRRQRSRQLGRKHRTARDPECGRWAPLNVRRNHACT